MYHFQYWPPVNALRVLKYKQMYIDGHSDPEFLLAFRRLIVKMISESKINQKTGVKLLLEVSTA